MRDLPMPGSPEINTTCPSPAFACSQRRISSSISSSRPTSGVSGRWQRLEPALGGARAEHLPGLHGSAKPLRATVPRSRYSNSPPISLRVCSRDHHRVRLGQAPGAGRRDSASHRPPPAPGRTRSDQIADDDQSGRDADAHLQGESPVHRASARPRPSEPARTARSASSSCA